VRLVVNPSFPLHIRTLSGLEEGLAQELKALGAQNIQPKSRLVICEGDLALLYKINLWCRTAIRVLRPLKTFPAADEKELYDGIREIFWSPWIKATGTLAVDANVNSSFTTHSLFVAQLTKDAVVDQFRENTGDRPSVDLDNPDLRIVVGLYRDTAQIFVDASGESLHRRGYRPKVSEAPLNEVLAAGILGLAEWDGSVPLVDPMCGSGTFLIEAGMKIRNIAPGLLRKQFGFQRWSDYDSGLFEKLCAEAKAAETDATAEIVGLEIDPATVTLARENVERAGLSDLVKVEQGDFLTWNGQPTTPGIVVMNPPYDERLAIENIGEFYQRIGDRLLHGYRGWTTYLLSGNLDALKYVGLESAGQVDLLNGSIECLLMKYGVAKDAKPIDRTVQAENNPKWREKAEAFSNRLRKNLKHMGKWAKRENISCWRVYNWDIPELPFLVDIYGDKLHFAEVPRNIEHSPLEHNAYLQLMTNAAATVLNITPDNIYFKRRKPQKSGSQKNTSQPATGEFLEVTEGGHKFYVNLADFLEVGLFLEFRKARAFIQKEAKDKDFLNLYGYTGAFTVYAAAGGAKSTVTVDTASSYLEWTQKNLRLNGLENGNHRGVKMDVMEFLAEIEDDYDLIVIDPPARSVNRFTGATFDVQEGHLELLSLALKHLRPGGKILFSTNYRSFRLDEHGLHEGRKIKVSEMTTRLAPADFERKPSHRCWLIEKLA